MVGSGGCTPVGCRHPAAERCTCTAVQERSEAAFRHNLTYLAAATAGYAGFAAIRGWLFSLVNTNLLQRLR